MVVRSGTPHDNAVQHHEPEEMSPMTVRWKPLLVLSGLFVMIAVLGFIAIAFTMVPRGAGDILPTARAERSAKQYEKALIHYKRALQVDGKNASIHEEMASMFAEWAKQSPAEKRAEVEGWRLASLREAWKFGKNLKEPRRQLLAAALREDDAQESLLWAKEVLALEPDSADAHFVVASESLDERSPVVPEIKRHLTALEAQKAPEVRVAWVKARLAEVVGDASGREAVLTKARMLTLPADCDPVDRTALVRLRALDAETTADPVKLAERVQTLQAEAKTLLSSAQIAPRRVLRVSLVLERVQKTLMLLALKTEPAAKQSVTALVDAIDNDVEAIFRKSLDLASKTDLHIHLMYADHLQFRGKYDRCREVVADALKSPLASLPNWNDVVMGLHAVAVESALANTKDASRFKQADEHIKALIASSSPRFQGLGHLFQGAIDLEHSGVAGSPRSESGVEKAPVPNQAKLRASALNHLKLAAAQLPDVVEAQARYGVALILSQEQGLGRQYLQNAMRLGTADPQNQVWAAWSMVQAGYPEEAEPIVKHLAAEVAAGRASRELEGTLHLLSGEVYQARRSPEDLKRAQAEYDRSFGGKLPPPAIQLRQAQIDVQLGQPARALERIERLRASGQGGTSAEHLAVLTLLEMGKKAEALETLAKARKAQPDSDELVQLESALYLRDEKPRDADKVLAGFLAQHPDNVGVVLMRAQVLADLLDDAAEARKLLISVADRTENSAPLVQLALLDLRKKDYDAVTGTIGKIRGRWKEAAAADLLDALLALDQGKLNEAADRFDSALKKDPGNKIVQYWKAQVDSRLGESGKAAQALESIVKQGTSKELESGLSLAAAAQSALANLSLQKGELDAAIQRFEGLRTGGTSSGLGRTDRWQLAAAYAVKGQWPAARREIASILNDTKNPPTSDERVRAANFYRQNKEDAAAIAQLEYVLSVEPAHPAAVITRAYIFALAQKTSEAAALVRKAIAAPQKDKPPAIFSLVLAELEKSLPPESDRAARAMAAIDQGLAALPKSTELVQAKYELLRATSGEKEALAFVEDASKGDTQGNLMRLLAEAYRSQQNFEKAEQTLRALVAKNPKDAQLAAALVRVCAQQADRAGEKGDRERERSLNDKTAALIRECRTKFPNELSFLQEDCELAYRRGDMTRATAITKEMDQLAKNSPAGPLMRARLYATQGRTRDVAASYADALERNPMQPDVRVMLGQTNLRMGQTDEALRQAKLVLEGDQDRADALILEARALALADGSAAQVAERRKEAIRLLSAAVRKQPRFSAGYHQIAEIQLLQGQPDAAAVTLRAAVEAVPDDGLAITQLVEILAKPRGPAAQASDQNLEAAQKFAETVAARDTRGNLSLALAMGFHQADQPEIAARWAEKASAKLDVPFLHLTYGDILLALAERSKDPAQAKACFERAVAQYDAVLKTQANSVEAINNKAWILHTYLGQSKKALDLASSLLGRVDPSTLPGEFFDTLGAIQEASGQTREAEESYAKGLGKSPDHPVLNYHMGRLMVADARRSSKARDYLQKAFANRNKLSPTMAAEVVSLMEKARLR
jgi:predicted Zn-dependent protease